MEKHDTLVGGKGPPTVAPVVEELEVVVIDCALGIVIGSGLEDLSTNYLVGLEHRHGAGVLWSEVIGPGR